MSITIPTIHRGEITIADLATQIGEAQYAAAQFKRRHKANQPINPTEILALADELERLAQAARACATDHESRLWVAGPTTAPTDEALDFAPVRRAVPPLSRETVCGGCGLPHYSDRTCSKCGGRQVAHPASALGGGR